MAEVIVYGSSDDLVEIEGNAPGCDEYPGEDEHFVLVGENGNAARLRVWYTQRGVWAVAAAPTDEDVPMLSVTIDMEHNGYSARARVEGVQQVIHEARQE